MSLIKCKRQLALKACDLFQAHRWWTRLDPWNGLVTLNYHRIGNSSETVIDPGVFSATSEQFEQQLRYLKADCDVIRVSEVADALSSGARRRCVLITFDDGYRDNYEVAFPALQQVGLSAVIFLTTGFLDQRVVSWWDEIAWIMGQSQRPGLALPAIWQIEPLDLIDSHKATAIRRLLRLAKLLAPESLAAFLNDLADAAGTGRAPANEQTAHWMTWEMVREMHRAGIDFGGHTVTHPVLSRCTLDQQRDEIRQSKVRIEQELGSAISTFSYPVGQPWSFSDETARLVREAGYQFGFSYYSGYSSYGSDLYDLRRVAMEPHIVLAELKAITQMPRLFSR